MAARSDDLTELAIVGRSCRLPGAPGVAELWDLLTEGRCAVGAIPHERWPQRRHFHPRAKEAGRSYIFAAGILPDIWGFDPRVFGLSPREAEQMDPQQRLLLELAFEACEDAGLPPSRLAGSRTGVYVGASATDYFTRGTHDPAAMDAYFATGTALSIVANRLSHVFDLHGPSQVVDTACSSSLVALHAAAAALTRNEVDAALVGGVNILGSPYAFVTFAHAAMLSPTGLCRAFAAEADGYVRAEGGVVLLVKRLDRALADGDRIHAILRAAGVNSDGRTSTISLPSSHFQAELLRQVYERAEIEPERVVYVEAHGTGTPAGDPIEAEALARVLGARRADPLLIGSIKTNIGHTETAAGLAGVLKAMLALEHDLAPASLHFACPNPAIDFARLNLRVAAQATPLPRDGKPRFAGVSSYGFGGTNAHAVLADAPARQCARPAQPKMLLLSARSETSLRALAGRMAESLAEADDRTAREIVAAAAHRREIMPERLVLPADDGPALAARLARFADSGALAGLGARAVAHGGEVAFVFTGNGSQWPGMGRAAFRANTAFRAAFAEIDAHFIGLAGWSLAEKLHAADLADHLTKTSIAQPLIFAIQAATVGALAEAGLRPAMVLGHSVGEVAAAHAAGILDLAQAARVIFQRSRHQEPTRDSGAMAVAFGPRASVEKLVGSVPGLVVAAHNSPQCVAVAGDTAALKRLDPAAAAAKLRIRPLDIAYPFHSPLMAPVEAPLLRDLARLTPKPAVLPFLSTVTGRILRGEEADAAYWWRNVRDPVLFQEGVERALDLGARFLVEIGPRATLKGHMRDIAADRAIPAQVDFALDETGEDAGADPIRRLARRLIAAGAAIDVEAAFGPDPGPGIALPAYPWDRQPYRHARTTEASDHFNARPRHPLIGARDRADALEWREVLDIALEPALADHVVAGQIYLPGAAFLEMALAAARDWLGRDDLALSGFEILQPLVFAPNAARELICRVAPAGATVEILSRARLTETTPTLHARGKILSDPGPDSATAAPDFGALDVEMDEIYAVAERCGLAYGPAYRRLARAARVDAATLAVELTADEGDPRYLVDPARLDSCFHGLNLLFSGAGASSAFLPTRFDLARPPAAGATLARAIIRLRRHDERILVADFLLFDAHGRPAGALRGARFQAMRHRPASPPADIVKLWAPAPGDLNGPPPSRRALTAPLADEAAPARDPLLADAWAASAALRLAQNLARQGLVDIDAAILSGKFPLALRGWASALLDSLADDGLLARDAAGFRLVEPDFPSPEALLRHSAARQPGDVAAFRLAAASAAMLRDVAAGRPPAPADAAFEAYELRSLPVQACARAVRRRLDALLADFPRNRRLRLLQVGCGFPLTQALALARDCGARLTLFDPDARLVERARLMQAPGEELAFLSDPALLPANGFDLVLSAGGLTRAAADVEILGRIAQSCASGGRIVAVEPGPSRFRDLTLGLKQALDGAAPPANATDWREILATARFAARDVRPIEPDGESALLIVADAPERPAYMAPAEEILIVRDKSDATPFALLLRDALLARGAACRLASTGEEQPSEAILVLIGGNDGDGEGAARLAARCMAIRQCVLAHDGARTVVVAEFAQDAAVAEGVFAFTRSFANEAPGLDFRRVELLAPTPQAAKKLADFILSRAPETDVACRDGTFEVLRYASPPSAPPAGRALRLEKSAEGGLDQVAWKPIRRRAPGPREVEVEIAASGLNFRDVMWAMSLLPDDMLEDGFAGPSLGLEFAGRVVALGADVQGLAIGDAVVGFCGSAFSTHATVDCDHLVAAPASLAPEAAATLPVAFLTAYYGLVHCADLQPGEWALIHGGAGGVGLAALQIALARGARPIATAGTPEKRELLRALGAEHVFDSRGGGFFDDVLRVTQGRGVAVVLNSLAGEAMERSLDLLEPFGRFIELGKRDYLANTPLGLRPFRRNLSYFGVDLDQMLLARPELSRRLFAELMAQFADGTFAPLPYSVYESGEVVEAMRAMQQSAHVGKIVIRPPTPSKAAPAPETAFRVSAEGTHLITGGLGGFGLAAARWLVERGARRLVLVGRSGAADAQARQALEELRQSGAKVRVEKCDIADADALRALFDALAASEPSLAGIMHAAMILDDSVIANLDEARLAAVLRPKATGAENLDRLTRGMTLDYFWLFSSATTVVGNPGQGAYVAANGFLEGFARARRSQGLPALAVAWGAIADAGVLARHGAAQDNLARRTGVKGVAAREALDALARHAALDGSDFVAIADMDWSAAFAQLPLLRSPSYDRLRRDEDGDAAALHSSVDLAELAERLPWDQARRTAADMIAEEVVRILRLPRDDVSLTKPLADIGIDSLVAVELSLSLEARFGLDSAAVAGGLSIMDLAGQILAAVEPAGRDCAMAERVARRHAMAEPPHERHREEAHHDARRA
ncbi:SDR family NAD(P)-dependent oxidoreductase [Rhodoblastus acidophilus]|uniref:SDR family NAD(P)-dependent oxidoreductase n=1 Tax=Candidatus Rhodoblastus alkanivorans TaxID=2954117 RepID=A0ABS9Z2J7_9HYPH|nr:SDR family NAD(P)-dependent oxidoreductase [Candidatus Rhodoblastus alkanivorans]MCI4681843.1 SDR family NAD(P)-dependent oxidoreductase [Candidatus Rhodoblastus alkanivorans]MDI4642893.1 SDR family NAD(P)-dependent oxidoreductase [Rhodoblastus acidophilus]